MKEANNKDALDAGILPMKVDHTASTGIGLQTPSTQKGWAVRIYIEHDFDPGAFFRIARLAAEAIDRRDGVTVTSVCGFSRTLIEIAVLPDRLNRLGRSFEQVEHAVVASVSAEVGARRIVDSKRLTIRLDSIGDHWDPRQRISDSYPLIMAGVGEDPPIPLSNFATINVAGNEPQITYNGVPALYIRTSPETRVDKLVEVVRTVAQQYPYIRIAVIGADECPCE